MPSSPRPPPYQASRLTWPSLAILAFLALFALALGAIRHQGWLADVIHLALAICALAVGLLWWSEWRRIDRWRRQAEAWLQLRPPMGG